ncbi:XRE family transcriptional regulator [Enterococcus sp. LJL128]|uniref:XRE family transcriptional regulator n=1 Tax=Enterococcus sp. LJL51 TaxID=3416656 RepID=UPI003CE9A1A5
MKEKETHQLLNSLKQAESFKTAISETKPHTIEYNIEQQLSDWLNKKKLSKSSVLRKAGIAEATGYQYFDGKRKPPRERLIALGIGMTLTLDELNELLKKTGFAQLYPKNSWDAVVIYGIIQQLTIPEIDDLLYQESLKTFTD